MSLVLLRWLQNSGNGSVEDRPYIPDTSGGNGRPPEAGMRVTLESRGGAGPGVVRLRILFPKGKADSLVLCNVAVATKPGGGKSHCPLCDLPQGWDSTGLSSRTWVVCDSRCDLGHRPPLWRPPSVKGRPTSGGVQGPFCGSQQVARWARCVVSSVLARVSIRGPYGATELGLRVASTSLPGLGQGRS